MSVQAVIYHGGCADGLACMTLWRDSHPNAVFYPGRHGTPPDEKLDEATELIFLDFTYPNEIMRKLLTNSKGEARRIEVFDHHPTAIQALEGLEYTGSIQVDKCGARILWSELHPEQEEPYWIMAIDAGDRWVWDQVEGAREFMAYLYHSWYVNDAMIHEVKDLDKDAAIANGRVISSSKTRLTKYVARGMRRCTLNGKPVGLMTNCSRPLVSECGSYLSNENQDLTAVVMAKYSIKHQAWHFSFRSRKGVNCLEEFSEGPIVPRGHPCACGAEAKSLDDFIKLENDPAPEIDSEEFVKVYYGRAFTLENFILNRDSANRISHHVGRSMAKCVFNDILVGVVTDCSAPLVKECVKYMFDENEDIVKVATAVYCFDTSVWNVTMHDKRPVGYESSTTFTTPNLDMFTFVE